MIQKKEKNRRRCYTVSFRVTPTEREELYNRIKLCGKTKQDYMIKSMLHQKITVIGNKSLFEELNKQQSYIQKELIRLSNINEIDDVCLSKIQIIKEILNEASKIT